MSPRRHAAVAALVMTSVLATAGIAWAATLTVTSKTLGAVAETVPAFFPDSLATANATTAGRPAAGDTITITFNRLVQVSSVCAGAAQASASLSGFTFTIANGAAGANDSLAVSTGPGACAAPKIGTVDLGSPSYVSAATSIPSSTIAVTLNAGPATTTVVLTLGTPAPAATTVGTAVIARYTPDAAIRDTSNRVVTSVAATTSATQF